MNVAAFKEFVCPVDQRPLYQTKTALKCDLGHVFDIAREGYCNLLLVQQKASRDPGDNKPMVAARRRFLDQEHFAPIVDYIFKIIGELCIKKSHLRIVDAGCGEGYYLQRIQELALASNHPAKLQLAGFDISKWAIKAAAKRSEKIAWAVAGNKHVPFAQESVDVILSVFGFPFWESFRDAQPNQGLVLVVDPAENHLIELRKIIYPKVILSTMPSIQPALDCGYLLEKEERLCFSVNLTDNPQIQDLLSMTPHVFKISTEGRRNLDTVKQMNVCVDVVVRIFKKMSVRAT